MYRCAEIDPTGAYRYTLERTWDGGLPCIGWIMLNPSTADATQDDPTIRRCIRFSQSWGYGSLIVVNLFAHRATSPKDLFQAESPVGPNNDRYIRYTWALCGSLIAAW